MYGGLSASSPHVVEPDCRAGSRVWSDLLLQRSNQSEYLHGRYAWIRGTSSRPHPSRFLHLEHTSSGGPSAPRATCIPVIPASCGEGLPTESRYRQAGSGMRAMVPQASTSQAPTPQVPQMVPPLHQPLPSSGGWSATPYQQVVQPPSKPKGRGVTFDSSATNLRPRVVKTLTVMGGRELEAEMITPGLPVTAGEHARGPPLG